MKQLYTVIFLPFVKTSVLMSASVECMISRKLRCLIAFCLIFSVTETTAYECLVAFEKAKIWNKKSFWEVEKDIEWVDC